MVQILQEEFAPAVEKLSQRFGAHAPNEPQVLPVKGGLLLAMVVRHSGSNCTGGQETLCVPARKLERVATLQFACEGCAYHCEVEVGVFFLRVRKKRNAWGAW